MGDVEAANVGPITVMGDEFSFVFSDADGHELACFVYHTAEDARRGAKFLQAALENAFGVYLPSGE